MTVPAPASRQSSSSRGACAAYRNRIDTRRMPRAQAGRCPRGSARAGCRFPTAPVVSSSAARLLLVFSLAAGGCQSVGPATMARDRAEYSAVLSESWKRQMLLNIVKLRYFDPPMFVDVGQIVAGYSIETAVNLGGTLAPNSNNSLGLGGSSRFTDRPTITYSPLTGSRFITGIISPISPSSLFQAIQAGWPADVILTLAANSINGHKNAELKEDGTAVPASEGFVRITRLMRRLQLSGAVSIRIAEDPEKKQTTLLVIRRNAIPPEVTAASEELRQLLGIDQDLVEFRLVYGSLPASPQELAVQSRSLLRVMTMLALHVEVPPEHLRDGRAVAGQDPTNEWPVRIYSGRQVPPDAFAAVHYRNTGFWIDDRDLTTKRAFGLIMLLFTMADTGGGGSQPLLTIPTS
jgi:hypothetical protein